MGSKPAWLGLLLGTAAVLAGGQASALDTPQPLNRIIVEWAPQTVPAQKQTTRADVQATDAQSLGRRFETLSFDSDSATTQALTTLADDPAVVAVTRDRFREPFDVPNDPDFDQQYALSNTGQTIAGVPGIAGSDIRALAAWSKTSGASNVVVAVIDSGYKFQHPDLSTKYWTNPADPLNGLDDDNNGLIDDYRGWDFTGPDADAAPLAPDNNPTDDLAYTAGHGVHVAGIIGASGNDGHGVIGVAPQTRVMPLRVCAWSAIDDRDACPVSATIAAINYAGKHGVDVANLSLGGYGDEPLERDAFAANPKTLFVVAAGNEHNDNDAKPVYPCVYNPTDSNVAGAVDNIICVAATNNRDDVAAFSNYGKTTVDLGAPGKDIYSTVALRRVFTTGFSGLVPLLGWTQGDWKLTTEQSPNPPGVTNDNASQGLSKSRTLITPAIDVTAPSVCVARWWEHVKTGNGETFQVQARVNGAQTNAVSTGSGQDSTQWDAVGTRVSGSGTKTVTFAFVFKRGAFATLNTGVWIDDVTVDCRVPDGQEDASSYALLSGTSMASPQVAGAAALLAAYEPKATVGQLRSALLTTVDPIASLNPVSGSRPVVTGGRLNADAALSAIDALVGPDKPTLTQKPAADASTDSASFVFTTKNTSAPVAYECALDSIVLRAGCTSPVVYTDVPAGSHTFHIKAVDTSVKHNRSAETTWTWTSPGPPPDTTITSSPPSVGTASTATFAFNSPKPGVTFQCSVGRAAFSACTSPRTLNGLGIGTHTFSVRAVDTLQRPDPTPAQFTWDVLAPQPPDTVIDAADISPVTGSGMITFSSPDWHVTFECALDTHQYTGCVSPLAVAGSLPGRHTLSVRAVDGLGRVDPSPAQTSWTVAAPASGGGAVTPAPSPTTTSGTTTQQPPPAVGNVTVKRKRTSAKLRWTPVPSATSYSLTRSAAKPQIVRAGAATLRKLKPKKAYKVQVVAVNAAGSSVAVSVKVPRFRK